ncbi:hypothetical protein H6F77_14220 [Microcoleus sp. FACHB-831]|uniref:hypothetical protein n=1 Tax=Microcoleus sp. FACHB-831 TaxID=2692827 RepID=UPI0016861281|nr:hypothetical protein [Microcoleus sp. FACHB-831]MBD1922234.1 hypothetical protein [Microcoleus sp. FACHB-831]
MIESAEVFTLVKVRTIPLKRLRDGRFTLFKGRGISGWWHRQREKICACLSKGRKEPLSGQNQRSSSPWKRASVYLKREEVHPGYPT